MSDDTLKPKPAGPINPDELHDLFAGSDALDPEDPLSQMRQDPNYSALIADLEYIAIEVKRILANAEETPSDDLWKKIESQLPTKPES